jgi:hypothetical protein
MSKYKRILQRLFAVAGLLASVFMMSGISYAQNVTTGYQSDSALQKGMIVRLKDGDSGKVEALTQNDVTEMLGVVVSSGDAAVSLSNPTASDQVYVATFGRYDVLVSTQNGSIAEGDYVTISSLGGVGMKASTAQQLVIGKALKGFDGRSDVESRTTLKTSNGDKEVRIGRISVEVSVAHNPLFEQDNQPGVPSFLSKVAGVVTDQPVAAFRIYASLAVFVVMTILSGSILFAGVRSGMVAVGRNPLAKHSVVRSLIQVTIMSLIVFVIGLFAVYLLLRI